MRQAAAWSSDAFAPALGRNLYNESVHARSRSQQGVSHPLNSYRPGWSRRLRQQPRLWALAGALGVGAVLLTGWSITKRYFIPTALCLVRASWRCRRLRRHSAKRSSGAGPKGDIGKSAGRNARIRRWHDAGGKHVLTATAGA